MPNPFFFAGKITNPAQFVGREKELKRIFGYLDTTHTGQIQHASVVGERRIGKSSLLYHISQMYETYLPEHQKYRFVYIDLDNPHCHTQHGLLTYILEQLALPIPEPLSLETFYDLLEGQNKDDMWAVLLMDEFEHLSQRADEFPDSFYDALRSLGNNNLVGIITSSQHTLQSLAAQEKLTSPFFNIFRQIDLGELTEAEANALLDRGKMSDQPFTDDDCQQILKIAGKHPACLQVVASLTYEAKANTEPVDWKAIKTEARKTPPFYSNAKKGQNKNGWIVRALKWLFMTFPQMVGRIFFDLLKYEKAAPTSHWLVGMIIILAVLGLLVGIIPWPLVIIIIRRFSEWFIR
jgi:hypothetical protein